MFALVSATDVRLIFHWITTESSRAGRDHSPACNPITKVKGRKLGRDWRSCCSCLAAPSRTRFPASLKGHSQCSHTSSTHWSAVTHTHLCPAPFLALKWRTVRLKFPTAAATFKLLQDQDRLLSCWTWVLMENEPISAHPWFEKQHFWKGRFLESLPLHLQLPATKPSEPPGPQ